jgi:hypothetical protein
LGALARTASYWPVAAQNNFSFTSELWECFTG